MKNTLKSLSMVAIIFASCKKEAGERKVVFITDKSCVYDNRMNTVVHDVECTADGHELMVKKGSKITWKVQACDFSDSHLKIVVKRGLGKDKVLYDQTANIHDLQDLEIE